VIGVGVNAVLATLSDLGRWPGGVNVVVWVVVAMTGMAAVGMILLAGIGSLPIQQRRR
jgi:hypothetical protein